MSNTNTTTTTDKKPIGRPVGPMPEEAKESMVQKHQQTKVIRHYLEALTQGPSKRGGYRLKPEEVKARIEKIQNQLDNFQLSVTQRLQLIQKRRNLETILAKGTSHRDNDAMESLQEAEEAFTKVAKEYSQRVGIEFATWREMKVPTRVLTAAGIHPKRTKSVDVAEEATAD